MRTLSIDIETFSGVDIKKSGSYKYAQSPDFEVLLFAYAWDGGAVRIVDLAQGEFLPFEIVEALADPNVMKHAYSASFEWYCLNRFWFSPIEQWRCTQVHGLYCGYTAGLGAVGEALGIPQDKRKLGTGMSLIRTFCIPTKPSKTNGQRTRTLPHHEPDKWRLFRDYCINDVAAEMEIQRRLSLFPVPDQEWQLWHLDQRINARGLAVDMQMVESALAVDEQVTSDLRTEAIALTGLNNPKSVQQLTKWLETEIGEEVENLQKGTVSKLIGTLDEGKAKRVLEIRQELSKTSTKKYEAMRQAACADGRVRGLLQFYGANRSGRWAGRLVQIQNLPRNYLSTLEYARQLVVEQNVAMLRFVYGNVPDTLSQLIRTAFIAPIGKMLGVADFAAIEARVIAWLAGEQWRLDVFNSHGRIYEASASQMFGVPIDRIVKGNPEYDLRALGKIAELALGYQGAVGALTVMDQKGELDEDEKPEIVKRWRNANRRIVDLWYSLEAAALEVMETGEAVGVKGLIFARESHYETRQDFFTIQLPSGRKLYYAKPFLKENDFGKQALHYWGMDQQTKKWTVLNTYGGKIVENVVQAIARDCLAVTLTKLDMAGFQTVLHVHDEAGIEVSDPNDLDRALAIMAEPIPWAPGLPLKGDGFTTQFYMKD